MLLDSIMCSESAQTENSNTMTDSITATREDNFGNDITTKDAKVKEGDTIILYGGYNEIFCLPTLQSTGIFNSRLGNFHHADIIGKRFGCKVFDRKTQHWLAILKPTPDLLTCAIHHRTQIIYSADINVICMLLNASPGKTIIECGTGSGSLTVNLAHAVTPGGKIHTFEFHNTRYQDARNDFKTYGYLGDVIDTHLRDVYADGFQLTEISELHESSLYADAAFLDLPQPWNALKHLDQCLKPLGRLVTFSPCIEQIQKTAIQLREMGYFPLLKPWGVSEVPQTRRANSQEDSINNNSQEFLKKRMRSPSDEVKGGFSNKNNQEGHLEWNNLVDYKVDTNQYQYPTRSHTSYLLVCMKPSMQD